MVRLLRTCWACPSQWDAWDADGKQYYIRYRHGWFSVEAVSGPNWVYDDSEPRSIIEMDHGDDDGGVMDDAEMIELTGGVFDWSHARNESIYE